MSPNLTDRNGFSTDAQQPGTALALPRTNSGVHRLPQVATEWVATNGQLSQVANGELRALAADVNRAVEEATVQYRENNSWVQLELDLWQAVTSTVEKWRRRMPAPARAPRPEQVTGHHGRRVAGPVRFQLRRR